MRLALALALVAVTTSGATISAGNNSHVSVSSLKEIETVTDSQFAGDPWEMLGYTRGTYLPGYGVVFTFEMSLIQATPISIFHPTVTAQERKTVHDRKLKQLGVLEQIMKDMVVKAATSIAAVPPAEEIVFEARLLSQPYEDHDGLPWRVTMSANRQKILDAVARHAAPAGLAALIEERKE